MPPSYYQRPTPKIGQGDILIDVPSVRLIAPDITFLRRRPTQRGPVADLYVVGDDNHKPQQKFNPLDDEMAARVQIGSAMILSHACDFDNSPTAPIMLGAIWPISMLSTEADREIVRAGRNGRFLHLPEHDDPRFEESYLDLGRITSVRASVVPSFTRHLSPTTHLLSALWVGFVYFMTRHDLDRVVVENNVTNVIRDAGGTV